MASELQVNTITEATSGSGITFAKDVIPATPLSHRNIIINGDFRVNQAGNKTGKTRVSMDFRFIPDIFLKKSVCKLFSYA